MLLPGKDGELLGLARLAALKPAHKSEVLRISWNIFKLWRTSFHKNCNTSDIGGLILMSMRNDKWPNTLPTQLWMRVCHLKDTSPCRFTHSLTICSYWVLWRLKPNLFAGTGNRFSGNFTVKDWSDSIWQRIIKANRKWQWLYNELARSFCHSM